MNNMKYINKDGRDYVYLCRSAELEEQKSRTILFEEDDIELAVFRVKGKLYCFNNECPHNHERKIHKGFLSTSTVSCPLHGWTFSLKDGKNKKQGGSLDSYDVFEENGKIFVEKPEPKIPKWMEG